MAKGDLLSKLKTAWTASIPKQSYVMIHVCVPDMLMSTTVRVWEL